MKLNANIRKRFRVSNKVKRVASNDRFRLSIFRSSSNISAQIIDDVKNVVNVGTPPENRVAEILSADTTKSSATNLLNDII